MKLSRLSKLAILAILLMLASGCAIGATVVRVEHDPLEKAAVKREGKVALTTFADSREEGHREHIGNKRNLYGMVLGWVDSKGKIEEILTDYFAEALREAGYDVSRIGAIPDDASGFDAIIEGEIVEFWLDLYMAVWQDMTIKIRALDGATLKTLWEKDIDAEETNTLWVGVKSEYEAVIRQALTKALNMAVDEFSSEEFQNIIKREAVGEE
jgi:hypothetical protein